MSLEAWKTFFEAGGVALLLLTFIFALGALFTSKKLNTRQAKQLEEQAVESKEKEKEFDKRLTEAKIDLGKQQERAAKAEASLLAFQRFVTEPRHLDWEASKKILENGPKGTVEVRYIDGNFDAFWVANDLFGILMSSKWVASFPRAAVGTLPVTGVYLVIGGNGWPSPPDNDPDVPDVSSSRMPEPAKTLYRALLANGKGFGAVGVGADNMIPSGTLVVTVGTKY